MSIRAWRRRALVVTLIAVGGLLLAASAVWWGGPVWRALVPMARPSWSTLEPSVKASAEAQFRSAVIQAVSAVIQAIGSVGAGVLLIFAVRTYRLNRRGQETERFVKALEHLRSDKRYERLGGILAMEQIIDDAPGQATHAAEVLNAFIRDHAPGAEPITRQQVAMERRAARHRATSCVESKLALPQQPDADVQRALTALTLPASRRHVDQCERVALSDLHLAGADFTGANLTAADFDGADLTGAWLHWADLTGTFLAGANLTVAQLLGADLTGAYLGWANLTAADFDGADLTDARLNKANLTDAQFDGLYLTGAWLGGADLTDAWLDGANLQSAKGLTVSQVVLAKPTKTTQLPPDIAADPRVIARIEEVEYGIAPPGSSGRTGLRRRLINRRTTPQRH